MTTDPERLHSNEISDVQPQVVDDSEAQTVRGGGTSVGNPGTAKGALIENAKKAFEMDVLRDW